MAHTEADPFAFLYDSGSASGDAGDASAGAPTLPDTASLFAGSEPVSQDVAASPQEAAATVASAAAAISPPDTLSTAQIIGAFSQLHERVLVLEDLCKRNGWIS